MLMIAVHLWHDFQHHSSLANSQLTYSCKGVWIAWHIAIQRQRGCCRTSINGIGQSKRSIPDERLFLPKSKAFVLPEIFRSRGYMVVRQSGWSMCEQNRWEHSVHMACDTHTTRRTFN